MAESDVQARIRAHPQFAVLVGRRTRLAFALSLLVLLPYYAFMLVSAYRPAWLARPLVEGSAITVGWPLGGGLILASWLCTGIYIWRANAEFDRRNALILRETAE